MLPCGQYLLRERSRAPEVNLRRYGQREPAQINPSPFLAG